MADVLLAVQGFNVCPSGSPSAAASPIVTANAPNSKILQEVIARFSDLKQTGPKSDDFESTSGCKRSCNPIHPDRAQYTYAEKLSPAQTRSAAMSCMVQAVRANLPVTWCRDEPVFFSAYATVRSVTEHMQTAICKKADWADLARRTQGIREKVKGMKGWYYRNPFWKGSTASDNLNVANLTPWNVGDGPCGRTAPKARKTKQGNKDCDEYPPMSTDKGYDPKKMPHFKKGGVRDPNVPSLLPLDKEENERHGSQFLNKFYNQCESVSVDVVEPKLGAVNSQRFLVVIVDSDDFDATVPFWFCSSKEIRKVKC